MAARSENPALAMYAHGRLTAPAVERKNALRGGFSRCWSAETTKK
jgi:hypothetical protein